MSQPRAKTFPNMSMTTTVRRDSFGGLTESHKLGESTAVSRFDREVPSDPSVAHPTRHTAGEGGGYRLPEESPNSEPPVTS